MWPPEWLNILFAAFSVVVSISSFLASWHFAHLAKSLETALDGVEDTLTELLVARQRMLRWFFAALGATTLCSAGGTLLPVLLVVKLFASAALAGIALFTAILLPSVGDGIIRAVKKILESKVKSPTEG